MSLEDIFQESGLKIDRYEIIGGGDISDAYCLHVAGKKYFLKVNSSKSYPAMFRKEADGLEALRKNAGLIVPTIIASGNNGHDQYLLLDWLERGTPANDCWQHFGAALASMHRATSPCFGWTEDNFIGSLQQLNQQQNSWHLFYAQCRIMPLVINLFNAGSFSKHDLTIAESFCKKIEHHFPLEPPALLHGDLWSGNYMVTANGYAAIFDPAVYYGHREMDIGMTRLFGGFAPLFYDAYNEAYPLENGWQQRLPLTQLYPLLIHAILFAGHYIARAKDIIKHYAG